MRGVGLEAASYFAAFSSEPLIGGGVSFFDNDQASWLTLVGRRAPGETLEQVALSSASSRRASISCSRRARLLS